MKISIVIPMYNASETIISALESVSNQSYKGEVEILVVDDGSTDDGYSLVEEYQRLQTIDLKLFKKSNGGVSSARNFGIKNATGEWVAFLDSDDVWDWKKLAKQVEVISLNNNINFIGCARNNETLRILGREIKNLYQATAMDLLIKMFPQTSTALVKKAVLDKVGFYDESLTHAEDGELWLRICSYGGFYYMPESLVITGRGKENFGESGLSANLYAMYLGNLKILEITKDNDIINSFQYLGLRTYYSMKYFLRIMKVKMR